MENGCWLIIGPLAWLYAVAGFITAIVKTPVLWFKEAETQQQKMQLKQALQNSMR